MLDLTVLTKLVKRGQLNYPGNSSQSGVMDSWMSLVILRITQLQFGLVMTTHSNLVAAFQNSM